MANPNYGPWIPLERIENLVSPEPGLVVLGLSVGAWLIYKVLLRGVSPERHRNLQALFKNLAGHMAIVAVLFGTYWGISQVPDHPTLERVTAYVGLACLLWGLHVFIRIWKILVFEYFFLSHMRDAVPVLLVDLFTLLLSVILYGWCATEIFNLKIAPLVATSAVFSLVLGLALQETLGNLLAAVALQFDKTFEIGDWVEIQGSGPLPWTGQVLEITWRSTVLLGISDELLTLPNRVIAQAQISNFNTKRGPIARGLPLKIPHGSDTEAVKRMLLTACTATPGVVASPAPLVMVREAQETHILIRLVYFIESYGQQFIIGDRVLVNAIAALEKGGVPLATPQVTVHQAPEGLHGSA